ncbi:hypothetical protein SAMN02745673_00383 [Marinactinospora thermotolerans DSM 45154]|uniref:Uncharacterized protein n=1 Tax=Marinactinospora thermotolerans DSM 45154 TaxID=1122192 RepID=A0A1T4KHQ7_9ACTN|nr:hypothetical protein SAMN02745673_00383 [Marinactinospora thermotolerans DSM 45154]
MLVKFTAAAPIIRVTVILLVVVLACLIQAGGHDVVTALLISLAALGLAGEIAARVAPREAR